MKSARAIYLFLFIVVIVPVTVFGITKWYDLNIKKLPVFGPENHVVGDFGFRDQWNKEITRADWNGKIIVAGYFFTSCPSVCPKVIAQLKRVQDYGADNVMINSFTVDPERDSVGRLKEYAEKKGIKSKWVLLTGDKISLYKFARTDLMIDATDGDGGPGDFIHSEYLALIDPLHHIRGYYKGTDEGEVNRMIRDINRLKIEFKL